MSEFVKIATFFEGENRTVQDLAKFYEQREVLIEKVKIVGKGYLDNPELIKGKRILLKPNWVLHDRKNGDEICLRTNDNLLIALVEVLLDNKPSCIVIGDAPIQGCNWDKMLSKSFYDEISMLSAKKNIPIEIKDFRRVTFNPELNNPVRERNPISDYVIFDLGDKSHLEPISTDKNNFRVTSYNPDRMSLSHRKGMHKYCITNELFKSDIVITIPKIKTHQKTGITSSLKILVGINGDKDFLPHHRVGGVGNGGDCYPGKNVFRRIAEYALDIANRNQGKYIYWIWFYLSLFLWKLSNPKNVHHMSAAWYGNDTTWRMVMDLNEIAIYGKEDGSIASDPQRVIFSLSDGIIGGQGDGPLDPKPLPLGILTFSNSNYLADACAAEFMGFNFKKIPLILHSFSKLKTKSTAIYLNEREIKLEDISNLSVTTEPPPGWIGYL